MALERRRNGQKKYYYTAKRVDGKVVKKYHGTGSLALLVEIEVRQIAQARFEELKKRDEFVAELWPLERISRLAKRASRQAIHSTYLLAGYQRSKCFHWKRKEPQMEIPTLASLKETAAPQVEEPEAQNKAVQPTPEPKAKPRLNSFWPESIEETIKLVMSGRRDLLGHLRKQLAEVPDLWRQVSDLTRAAIQGWAGKIAKGNVAFQESIVLAAIEERDRLLGQASTIMQRAAVDHFVIAKLQLAYFNIVSSCADESTDYSKTGIAIEKRHRSAEYQFREATRQLAKIKVIQEEISPDAPASASIRLFNPDVTQKKEVA